MNRRQLLVRSAGTAAFLASASFDRCSFAQTVPTSAATPPASKPAAGQVPDDADWHDVREWGVEGRGFDDTESYFDRLPARAKGVVRENVWNLSHHTSGMSVRFEAETPDLYVRYEVLNPTLAMPHMPATGVSGLDLYGHDIEGTMWPVATYFPEARSATKVLVSRLAPGGREYRIYLPLYNGVKSLAIGVPRGATFAPLPPRKDGAILFYGTSITQGGCASRPGMSFVNILGRHTGRPVYNFGFSGNGQTEVEVARFLAELNPALYVLDCLPNTQREWVTPRTEAVVKVLRDARPSTSILLLEQRQWSTAALLPHLRDENQGKNAALRQAFENLQASGVKNLHYRKGSDLIGSDGEACVDGSHPTDLGMMRYTDALRPDVLRILNGG